MLGFWRSHADYQNFVKSALSNFAKHSPWSVLEYEQEISKVFILNLDHMQNIMKPLYSKTGKPAQIQPEIFRSFVLCNALHFPLNYWVLEKLPKNPVLQIACGFDGHLPGIASYYDFINRLIKLDEKPRLKKKKRKPKKKYGKNKMPPKHPNIVLRLVDKILAGRRFPNRPERFLQQIFAEVCVKQSIELGLIPKNISISGDGTCVETGASPYGVKVCECKESGIYNCSCTRKFSDPNASWGWDSHKERWFYGYSGYFISTYNKAEKLDLPLYLRLVAASRHDSVSAVVALAEFRDLYPDLKVETFISDSASDNYATYNLLEKWDINAVIALNSKNILYPAPVSVDKNGKPICPGGNKMVLWGYCPDRKRIKYRCPRVLGKASPCSACKNCSPSKYGRTIYINPGWDLRAFCRIPRGTDLWKSKMKERTACERINDRILQDYGIENSHTRGKKRISFFVAIAAFNIHLDAQLKKLKNSGNFSFDQIFTIAKSA